VWLVLAWRGTGRPHRLGLLDEPLLAALPGRARAPSAQTLRRSLRYFSAKAVRRAVEAAYLAELPRRTGRVWAALDAHQVPYWGRGELDRFEKGWSGSHSRRLRGYRLYLAVDPDTGQVITFALTRGRTRDARLAAAFARRLRVHQPRLGRRPAGDRRPVHPRLRPLAAHPRPARRPEWPAAALAAGRRRRPARRVPLG
jgi:hypothetical protein